MARPSKDQADPAERRLKDAFWVLLKEHDLHDITVSMITKQAQCNRGTFYYHYDSLAMLLDALIEEELLAKSKLPHTLFCLMCQDNTPNQSDALYENELFSQHVRRFGLMMDRAGQEYIDAKVKETITETWEGILCTKGESLSMDSRLLIEYSASGMIGIIGFLYREGLFDQEHLPARSLSILRENTRYLITRISQAQNISLEELRYRIYSHIKETASIDLPLPPRA